MASLSLWLSSDPARSRSTSTTVCAPKIALLEICKVLAVDSPGNRPRGFAWKDAAALPVMSAQRMM